MRSRFTGLWRHPDFMRLWSGQTISVFGSLTTRIALPFTAVIYLDARPFQVALVTASDVLAGICFGLIAGVWVDRLHRRPIMIAADLGRVLLLGSVPLAALLGWLHMEQLYAVAFTAGILTTFFDVAYQSYLPSLIGTDDLVEGNSKLAASSSVAEFAAFGIAGWLVQIVTAPGAILIDAVSFLFSAGAVATIRTPEPEPAPIAQRQSVLAEIREGAGALLGDPVLRAIAVSWIALSLTSGMIGAVFLLFTSRQLGFSPGVLGMIFAVGGLTSLFAALLADWCRRTLGVGNAMVIGMALGGVGLLVMSGAQDASLLAAALLIAQQFISDPGWTVYEINQMSLRQAIAPPRMLGRINAAIRFSGLVAMLFGALVAGVAADAVGPRPVLFAGAGAAFAGALSLLVSPIRQIKATPPETEDVASAAAS